MTALTKERFDELTKDIDENAFRNLVPLIMESFEKQRGRTLDTTQVAALAQGLLEMSATMDTQISYIGELQGELDDVKKELAVERDKKGKLWRP